jgi:hypothetical protein
MASIGPPSFLPASLDDTSLLEHLTATLSPRLSSVLSLPLSELEQYPWILESYDELPPFDDNKYTVPDATVQHKGGGKLVPMKGNYRGSRYHPLDGKLLEQFTAAELRLKGKSWQTLLDSKELTEDETVRVKQLHRRELCKGYSKDTRSRFDKKNKSEVPPNPEEENVSLLAQVSWLKARVADLEYQLKERSTRH